MQEKESIMTVWCELKIPSFEITVQHHSASLVILHDGIFNPHLTTIEDSYILCLVHLAPTQTHPKARCSNSQSLIRNHSLWPGSLGTKPSLVGEKLSHGIDI